jgi:translin
MKFNFNSKDLLKDLEKKQLEQDKLISISRILIRECSNSIKLMHANDLKAAKINLLKLKNSINKLKKAYPENKTIVQSVWQEYAEAYLFLCCLEKKPFPSYKKLGLSAQSYVLGLLDLFGELRRKIIYYLANKNLKEAEFLFSIMQTLFDELLLFRFSSSLLPNFKKKQDIARIQLEESRIQILQARWKYEN